MKIYKLGILCIILLMNCSSGQSGKMIECINDHEKITGNKHIPKSGKYEIVFPTFLRISQDHQGVLSASNMEKGNFSVIQITEFNTNKFNFDKKYQRMVKSHNKMKNIKNIQEGQTEVGGYAAKWILLENAKPDHARVDYFFEIPETEYFYKITTELFTNNRSERICELKKSINTFVFK